MNGLLPHGPPLLAFLVASLALAVTPGPGVIYIVTRSLVYGRRGGVASVAGIAVGNLGNALAAAFGLAAVFAVSTTAFTLIKYAGAAYLVVLGVRALFAGGAEHSPEPARVVGMGHLFRDGLVVALLNPKTTLFFAAFLPQFVNGHTPHPLQIAVLGMLFVVIAAVTDSVYAWTAGAVNPLLSGSRISRMLGRYFSGGAYIGLGVCTAVTGVRPAR